MSMRQGSSDGEAAMRLYTQLVILHGLEGDGELLRGARAVGRDAARAR